MGNGNNDGLMEEEFTERVNRGRDAVPGLGSDNVTAGVNTGIAPGLM